jgi:nitrite reductase/ring-hydroxylating ferredoxin subunit
VTAKDPYPDTWGCGSFAVTQDDNDLAQHPRREITLTEFTKVATINEVGDGEMMVVTTMGGNDVVIARVGDEYFAFDAICSHAFGMLDQGELHGYDIECPIHDGRFDIRTGKATKFPAYRPITAYAVQISGTDVLIGPPRTE